jgi:hypothetical protein
MNWEREKKLDRWQQSHRFGLAVAASFSWLSPDAEPRQGEGITRDISAHGVFIYAHRLPIKGALVEVNVSFPSLDANGRMVRLSGRGIVVRLYPSERKASGFAAPVNFAVTATRAKLTSKICNG